MGRAEDLFERIRLRGEASIDELIADRVSEELFLDFKRSGRNGHGTRLADDDRDNLAKALSGFANSEGGVIVWGIDCRKNPSGADLPGAKFPLEDPARFRSWIEGALSGCTIPSVPRVENHPMTDASNRGYVATLVPKSELAPHQVVKTKGFYIRTGSSFEPAPYSVLAGMFGRRPQPLLEHRWSNGKVDLMGTPQRWTMTVDLSLYNHGPGVVRDAYVNLMAFADTGEEAEVNSRDSGNWSAHRVVRNALCVISLEGIRIPPSAFIQPPLQLVWRMASPPRGLSYELSYGADGLPTNVVEHRTEAAALSSAFDAMIGAENAPSRPTRLVELAVGAGYLALGGE